MKSSLMNRRRVLQSACSAAASLAAMGLGVNVWAEPAQAIGPRSSVGIGLLRHGNAWDHRPEALRRLLWESGKRTSMETAREIANLDVVDDELFYQPLIVLTGTGVCPPFDEKARTRLDRYIRYGGMLYIDVPSPTDPFVESIKTEMATIFAGQKIEPLPSDHVIYKSFFLLNQAEGRTVEDTRLYGLEMTGRIAVLMTQNDLLGALERDRFGSWRFECVPGGDAQRERAVRLGINILMYATCLDYKADQVHIPFIMKKKRR